MVSKAEHLKKLFKIMIYIFILLTLTFNALFSFIPTNIHYLKSLSKKTNKEIYTLELDKPIINLIGDESYKALKSKKDMRHTVKVLDKSGELRLVKDKTIDQHYQVLSSIKDTPKEVISDYEKILLNNSKIESLNINKAVIITLAFAYLFLCIALLRVSIIGLINLKVEGDRRNYF